MLGQKWKMLFENFKDHFKFKFFFWRWLEFLFIVVTTHFRLYTMGWKIPISRSIDIFIKDTCCLHFSCWIHHFWCYWWCRLKAKQNIYVYIYIFFAYEIYSKEKISKNERALESAMTSLKRRRKIKFFVWFDKKIKLSFFIQHVF